MTREEEKSQSTESNPETSQMPGPGDKHARVFGKRETRLDVFETLRL